MTDFTKSIHIMKMAGRGAPLHRINYHIALICANNFETTTVSGRNRVTGRELSRTW